MYLFIQKVIRGSIFFEFIGGFSERNCQKIPICGLVPLLLEILNPYLIRSCWNIPYCALLFKCVKNLTILTIKTVLTMLMLNMDLCHSRSMFKNKKYLKHRKCFSWRPTIRLITGPERGGGGGPLKWTNFNRGLNGPQLNTFKQVWGWGWNGESSCGKDGGARTVPKWTSLNWLGWGQDSGVRFPQVPNE